MLLSNCVHLTYWPSILTLLDGGAENAGPENDGERKLHGLKMQDLENDGPYIAGPENAGPENNGQNLLQNTGPENDGPIFLINAGRTGPENDGPHSLTGKCRI